MCYMFSFLILVSCQVVGAAGRELHVLLLLLLVACLIVGLHGMCYISVSSFLWHDMLSGLQEV
jgi:hypothetical protein